jgi:hypothetical protein
MNDRPPVGIGEDAMGVEIAGPVREGPRQAHGGGAADRYGGLYLGCDTLG